MKVPGILCVTRPTLSITSILSVKRNAIDSRSFCENANKIGLEINGLAVFLDHIS